MRALAGIACALLLWTGACGAARADEIAALDAARSHAKFSVAHIYVQHVTGSVPIAGGTVAFAPGSTLPAKIAATLDARRVDTGNADRDEDLQGPDWFETRKFPTWTFASTAIRAATNGAFAVDGLLTIHGVPQAVVLSATPAGANGRTAYHAVTTVNRRLFGMKVTPIDALLGTDVEIVLDVVLAR